MEEPLDRKVIEVLESFDAADSVLWSLLDESASLMVPLVVKNSEAVDAGYVRRFGRVPQWGPVPWPTPLLVATATDEWAAEPTGEGAFGAGLAVAEAHQPRVGGEWNRLLKAAGFGYWFAEKEVWCLAKLSWRALAAEHHAFPDQVRALAEWGRDRLNVLLGKLEPPGQRSRQPAPRQRK